MRSPQRAKELLVNPNECRIINPELKRFLLLKLQCGLFPPRRRNNSTSFSEDPQWGPAPCLHRANREPALTPWRKQGISRGLVTYRQLSAHQCFASLQTPHECALIRRARETRTVCKHAHTFSVCHLPGKMEVNYLVYSVRVCIKERGIFYYLFIFFLNNIFLVGGLFWRAVWIKRMGHQKI